MCVLILLYMCPHTAMYVSSYYYVCVVILLYMSLLVYFCPHTNLCVSSYYYICPHTTIYVSSYYSVCVHMQVQRVVRSAFAERYSVYLIYWYKSTNTDLVEGAASTVMTVAHRLLLSLLALLVQ